MCIRDRIKAIENFKIANPGVRPDACFMVSCVGRRLLLGDDTKTEVETVLRLLPKEIGFLGFYAYGEIAPHKMTKLCSLHNQTLTLTSVSYTHLDVYKRQANAHQI